MASSIYKKPILFALAATITIMVGTVVTMFYPMMTPEMHPKLDTLKPYTALQLAGKDIYQREGCNNCHTQTVRPLKSEVLRYGEYSKAGEFYYDRPFLWGSKRTGPDIARVGGKYPDAWHYRHFEDPQSFFAESNMPKYGWLKNGKLDPADIEAHMKANDFPYTKEDISSLSAKTELDALVAYIQVIGTAVTKKALPAAGIKAEEKNPLAGDQAALHQGEELFEHNCASCHGKQAKGGAPIDLSKYTGKDGSVEEGRIFEAIANGTKGGMPPFGSTLDKNKIWSLVMYVRSVHGK